MNKPQHNPPQHCVCLQIIRGPNERKYDFSSKELFCDGVYGTNSVSCEAFNYMEGLVQNFNVFECPVIQLIQYMLFIPTNTEISTMQCCLSLKCPKVHHNQMAQNLNGSSP